MPTTITLKNIPDDLEPVLEAPPAGSYLPASHFVFGKMVLANCRGDHGLITVRLTHEAPMIRVNFLVH